MSIGDRTAPVAAMVGIVSAIVFMAIDQLNRFHLFGIRVHKLCQ